MLRVNTPAAIGVAVAVALSMGDLSARQRPAAPGPAQAAPAGPQTPGTPAAPGRGRGGGFRQPDPIDFQDRDGWVSMFDGTTLKGWSGDKNWKVEEGAITIESTCEQPSGTVYLVWQGGDASDFELKLEMKGTGMINGGVQYRGWIAPPRPAPAPATIATGAARATGATSATSATGATGASAAQGPCPSGAPRGTPPDRATEAQWNMAGAQYDFDAGNRYTGQFYEQSTGRGIIAWKGQVVRTEEGKNPRLLATLGDAATIDSYYKPNEWNELHIIAVGNQMTHILNGHVLSVFIDEDPSKFHGRGMIGLEVESTGKLYARNISLRKLQ